MRASTARPRLAGVAVYVLILVAFLAEKAGQTTTDTKASLMVDPGELLRSTFSLWNPQMSLGELQNQAYGYLMPMGPFFAGLHGLGVPDWITERVWSWLIIVVACEGARLVCRQLGINAWAALGAGLAFGLNVRLLSEVGVRSAEVLPTAMVPWMLLPVIWALRGRIDPRLGALWSVAAYLFSGAVNGTATIAPLPLIAIVIVWGCRRGLVRWSMLGWWGSLVVLASLWWASSLVQLSSYSPPFFDYVEDARTTTSVTGAEASLRGASNWVGYLTTAGDPSWPGAWDLNYEPVLVLATGLIAAVSLLGLVLFRSPWRTPLVISAMAGLTCLTIGHTSEVWLQSPLAGTVQELLDQPFALLRNVAKIDPMLRLPMAVGFGAALSQMARWAAVLTRRRARRRAGAVRAGLLVTCLLVVASAQPVLTLNTRIPGWEKVPSYWSETAQFLERQPGQNGAWIVPGAGFGIQTWGWTMDEPMSLMARSPWITRSQAPLAPAETIRMLSALEDLLETGSGSPRLGELLNRIGLGYVVLRRDLDPALDDGIPANLVSSALAKSSGLTRVRTFGDLALGPAIEVYEVTDRDRSERSDLRVLDASVTTTVSSGPTDVLAAVGAGLLGPEQAAGVVGDPGVTGDPELVGDTYRLRERQFGRVHATEGAVLAPGEPHRAVRRIENYPGSPGADPVVADYRDVRYVAASSSQAYPESLGPIRSEAAPYAAVDGDQETRWTSAFGTRPRGQWIEVHYQRRRPFGVMTIGGDADPTGVTAWRITAGGTSVVAPVDPFTGTATADLRGVSDTRLRVSVAAVGSPNRERTVSIREISGTGLPVERTLVVPPSKGAPAAFLFTARPETRACVPTLLGPDCDPSRFRTAEEPSGIDREVTFTESGEWSLAGTVVARTDQAIVPLLDPFAAPVVMHASSTYYDDPSVSPRMAYDGLPTTSWIANARDPEPTLEVEFARPTRVDQILVTAPAEPGVVPLTARIVAGKETRNVRLDEFGRFEPLVAKRLSITFANATRPGVPLGVAEVRLGPGKTAVPFDGRAATGVGCGFGPNVYVDGQRYLTKVEGTMGNVAASGPLELSLCGPRIPITAGTHRIRIASTIEFQPVRVHLTEPDRLRQARPDPRTWNVLGNGNTAQEGRIGPGGAAVLATARNWNEGWVATLNGKRLPAQRIDGWAQGWQVPPGDGGTIRVTFEPQRAYRVGLIGGLVLVALILSAALVLAFRVRLGPATELPERTRRRPRRRGAVSRAGAAFLGAGLLVGVPGLVGVALAAAARRGYRAGLWLAGALVVAGPVVTALSLARHGPSSVPDLANGLAAIGAVGLLVYGLGTAHEAVRDEHL